MSYSTVKWVLEVGGFGQRIMSYQVDKAGKPYIIVEDLILPATVDMAGTLQASPLPNNSVSKRISGMVGDILKLLLLHTWANDLYDQQLDKSTDVARCWLLSGTWRRDNYGGHAFPGWGFGVGWFSGWIGNHSWRNATPIVSTTGNHFCE